MAGRSASVNHRQNTKDLSYGVPDPPDNEIDTEALEGCERRGDEFEEEEARQRNEARRGNYDDEPEGRFSSGTAQRQVAGRMPTLQGSSRFSERWSRALAEECLPIVVDLPDESLVYRDNARRKLGIEEFWHVALPLMDDPPDELCNRISLGLVSLPLPD